MVENNGDHVMRRASFSFFHYPKTQVVQSMTSELTHLQENQCEKDWGAGKGVIRWSDCDNTRVRGGWKGRKMSSSQSKGKKQEMLLCVVIVVVVSLVVVFRCFLLLIVIIV